MPEYDTPGIIRERQGARISGIVPTNTYPTSDDKYVIIGGNGDSIYKRLMTLIGREDLAQDPRLEHNDGRVAHEALIDAAIEAWTRRHTYAEIYETLDRAGVPVGPIYSIAEIRQDPHYQARGMFEEADLGDGDKVKLPTLIPKLSATPGRTTWIGPPLGAHKEEIYGEMPGLSAEEMAALKSDGVI